MGENDSFKTIISDNKVCINRRVYWIWFSFYIFCLPPSSFLPLSHYDTIWRHRYGSTLVQIVVCCPMSPRHPLNQCWLMIESIIWHSHRRNFTISAYDLYPWHVFKGYIFKIAAISPRCQWVNTQPLQWRQNERDDASNHQRIDCLHNRLFRRRSKKTSKLRVTGLPLWGEPVNSPHKGPVTRKMFPFNDVIMNEVATIME